MISITLTGFNYKQTPIEVREQLSLDDHRCLELLSIFKKDSHIQEAVVLSTCNRTELYAVGNSSQMDNILAQILHDYLGVNKEYIAPQFYHYSNKDAVEHLFNVAAGLDSMVIGEDQILAQIRHAYSMAIEQRMTDKILNKIFHHSFRVGKRSRSETKINAGATSVGSVAVDLVRKIFPHLSESQVLIIGAGEMAQKILLTLKKFGAKHLIISNRTFERAAQLAQQFSAQAVPLQKLRDALLQTDIVLSATSSPNIVISHRLIKKVMNFRKNKKLCMIDIAMPRDIDKAVRGMQNILLYDIDDLKNIAEVNHQKRKTEIPKVKAIITEELQTFSEWFNDLEVVPAIIQLQKHFEGIRQRQLMHYRKNFYPEDWEQLDKFSKTLMKKFLHGPLIYLHSCKGEANCYERNTIREFFAIGQHEKND